MGQVLPISPHVACLARGQRREMSQTGIVQLANLARPVVTLSPLTFPLLRLTFSPRSFGTRKWEITSSSFLVSPQKVICLIPNRI